MPARVGQLRHPEGDLIEAFIRPCEPLGLDESHRLIRVPAQGGEIDQDTFDPCLFLRREDQGFQLHTALPVVGDGLRPHPDVLENHCVGLCHFSKALFTKKGSVDPPDYSRTGTLFGTFQQGM